MKQKILALLSVCALVAGVTACRSSKTEAPAAPSATVAKTSDELPADGSTLKAEPAGTVSPINDQKMTSPVVILTASPSSLQFPTATAVSLQYRFQVFSAAGALVDDALVSGTTYQVAAVLIPNTRHTWRVRPEVQGEGGPWSATASFVTEDPAIINDPLTNSSTIGRQIGGRFIAGEGWQSLSLTDAIAWDVPAGCITCKLEFDATNFGAQEGLTFQKDLKWVSMGDPNTFDSFGLFRNSPWKMHLVQRADFPTGVEIIWRNGGTDPGGGDPGDHRIKLTSSPIVFRSTNVYHFTLNWGIYGYSIAINGIPVLEDGWDHWYELAPLHIELGCRPRAESFVGAIYRNIKLTKP
jgi:hypothetical protein